MKTDWQKIQKEAREYKTKAIKKEDESAQDYAYSRRRHFEAGYVRERQRVWRLRKQIKHLQKAIKRRNAYIQNLEKQVKILMHVMIEEKKRKLEQAIPNPDPRQMSIEEEFGTFRVGGTN